MPEGPEIRKVADQLRAAVAGHEVCLSLHKPGLEHFAQLLSSSRVKEVEARGKALLIHFDSGYSIYCHSQLYGRWKFLKKGSSFQSRRQLRLSLCGPTHEARLYSATTIEVLQAPEILNHPFLSKLGPDLLDPSVNWRQLLGHLRQPKFYGRQLAALLLDQAAFCGSGNYLRSEILFVAKVHPSCSLKSLPDGQQQALASAALEVARRAYKTGGVTNTPERVVALKKARQPRRAYRHLVFGREGRPCYTCSNPVLKLNLANRRLYYCPHCQGDGK